MSNMVDNPSEPSAAGAIAFGVAALVIGTVLPLLTAPLFGQPFVNPLWGSVYSLGFFLLDGVFGDPGFGSLAFFYALIGGILWPILASVLTVYFSAKVFNRGYRQPAFIACIASLFFIMPASFFSGLPSFIGYFR
jgi:hypothetical protein